MAGVSLSQEVGARLEEVVGVVQQCCEDWKKKPFKKAAYLQGHDTGLISSHPVYQCNCIGKITKSASLLLLGGGGKTFLQI